MWVHNACNEFLADAGLFASRIGSPAERRGLRAGLDRILTASDFDIRVMPEIVGEVIGNPKLRPRTLAAQARRLRRAQTRHIDASPVPLGVTPTKKTGLVDLMLLQTAIDNKIPIVTGNKALRNQVMNFPAFRNKGLRILVAGEDFTGVHGLRDALNNPATGLVQ